MRTVTICKADPISGEDTQPVRIDIVAELPERGPTDDQWYARRRRHFDEEAARLEDALVKSLPGGTLDALLGRLLARKASVYSVVDR